MVSQVVIVTVFEDGGPVDRQHYYYVGCEANADVEVAVKNGRFHFTEKNFDLREGMYRTYNIR